VIKAAIFDIDGTVLDSMSIWDNLGVSYLENRGIKPEQTLNDRLKTMSLKQAAQCFVEEYGVQSTVEEICNEINRNIDGFYRYEAPLKPGVDVLLRKLKAAGVRLSIATATDDYLVEAALERCGVLDCFESLHTCTHVGCGKSKPLVYRAALEKLAAEKSQTAVFEDAYYALQTAKADGFITVGVYDRHENNREAMKNLADFYIEDYRKIEDFLKFALE
jgi:HAD superfamily hydrolase (TIGR01509 family)